MQPCQVSAAHLPEVRSSDVAVAAPRLIIQAVLLGLKLGGVHSIPQQAPDATKPSAELAAFLTPARALAARQLQHPRIWRFWQVQPLCQAGRGEAGLHCSQGCYKGRISDCSGTSRACTTGGPCCALMEGVVPHDGLAIPQGDRAGTPTAQHQQHD